MMLGLSRIECARLGDCLDRLTPHLRMNCIAVTGGVGMQMGLAALGHRGVRRHVADLDLVATSLDAVSSRVVDRFLVSHYHVVGTGVPKFMIQLVDPASRIRIDVFPDLAGCIADARTMHIGQHAIPVLPLNRIFEHKIHTLVRASPVASIDPKHVHDALFLGAVLSKPVPDVTAAVVAPDIYDIDADRACTRCALSLRPAWPLAPKERVFELLGWQKAAQHPLAADGGARDHEPPRLNRERSAEAGVVR
jgi:hypothetical protein